MNRAIAGRFWLITVAAVLGTAATLALGTWQLSRGQEKSARHERMEQRRKAPDHDARELLAAPTAMDLLDYPVVLRGSWLARYTVFLDNRQMQGRPGFYVVTPLRIQDSDAVVMVLRGWIPRNFGDRQKLAPVETPDGVVELRGLIAPPPAKLYEFAGAVSGPIRQNLDLGEFRRETGLPLLDLSVQQTGTASQGLQRDWPEAGSGADKNYGYAFQWWAMSGLIAVLYVWFQFIVPLRKAPHD